MPNEREAFVGALHKQYHEALLKSCYRHAHYDARYLDLAEDCVQDAFVLLMERYDQLAEHPAVGRWLLVTCLHKMDNAIFKRRVRDQRAAFSMDEHPDWPVPSVQNAVESWLESDDARACVAQIRQALTAKESAVFDDYFLDGLSAQQIAAKRSTTPGGVKSILRKIRRKSRDMRIEDFLLLLGILSRFR